MDKCVSPLWAQATLYHRRAATHRPLEHEDVLEAVQKRLDKNPRAMRQRRETAEHPFGTLKMRMGATHFLMKRLPKVATEMPLHALAYNLTRVALDQRSDPRVPMRRLQFSSCLASVSI